MRWWCCAPVHNELLKPFARHWRRVRIARFTWRLTRSQSLDPLATARLLAKAIEAERPDLILTGLQSDDSRVRTNRSDSGRADGYCLTQPSSWKSRRRVPGIRVKRELEDGWFQHVSLPLPALLTIQKWNQETPLRNPDGHQESKNERSEGALRGRARRRCGAYVGHRAGLSAAARQTSPCV